MRLFLRIEHQCVRNQIMDGNIGDMNIDIVVVNSNTGYKVGVGLLDCGLFINEFVGYFKVPLRIG